MAGLTKARLRGQPQFYQNTVYDYVVRPLCYAYSIQSKGQPMTSPIFEFSDDFDAAGWWMERMSKPDYDPYYDDPEDH